MKNLVIAFCALWLAGCLDTSSLSGTASIQNNFVGCTTGTPLNNSSISVSFSFPSNLEQVVIYRDGLEIGRSKSQGTTSIIDSGLIEGVTYHYTCDGYLGAKKFIGSNTLDLAPVNTNAPTFAGITSATSAGAGVVRVNWGPESSSAARASHYKIFANIGSNVNWNADPVATVPANNGIFKYDVASLGDELAYSLGVRACTKENICDGNTHKVSLTVPDTGAPKTLGAESVTASNFIAYIVAPWDETKGAVQQRQVFMCTGANCTFGTSPTSIFVVSDPTNPPTTLTISDSINEYSTYSFKVVDVDPSGNSNANTKVVTLTTGDLSYPLFNGITTLSRGTPADSKVIISFIALDREGTSDPNAVVGASRYLLYVNKALYPDTAANACNNLLPSITFSAANYSPGVSTYTVENLDSRSNYSFCLRAQDATGNSSVNALPASIITSDTTPPDFLGVQSISFRSDTRSLRLGWNPSAASDLRRYVVKLWKNTATPLPANVSVFNVDKTNSNGVAFSLAEFPLNDYDVVYASVNACDNTMDLGIGAPDNCTSLTSYKSTVIPDINPPPGFAGISVSTDLASPNQGQALIKWQVPAWTADYSGFRIYSVNSDLSLNLHSSCPCVSPGACNNADNSCLISGLDPSRTYRFHVRAYDAVGNETNYLNPGTSYSDLKIKDSTPPIFNSGLAFDGLTLKWSPASDNQYAVGNTISYQVYRKGSSTFASATIPENDGTLVQTLASTSFYENTLSSGGTYFYTVCASDSQNNRTCDGIVRTLVATDVAPPTINSFTHTKSTATLKKWDLSWNVFDSGTVANLLRVRIYSKSGNELVTATTSDQVVFDGYASTTSVTNLTGPSNTDTYVSYLLWVQDAAGNISTSSTRLYSENALSLSATSGATSLTTGGRLVVLKGSGFSFGSNNGYGTGTVVKVGGINCTTTSIINSQYATCVTPSSSAGYKDIEVENPDGSKVKLVNAHQYVSSAPTEDPCLDSTKRAASPFAAGAGTTASPYVVCTNTQLSNVLSGTNWTGGRSYKLGDNIDLNNGVWRKTSANFIGIFDGDNYAILNNRISDGAHTVPVYFFTVAGTDTATFKNVKFLNWTGTTNAYIYNYSGGVFSGIGNNGQLNLDNFTFSGTFTSGSTVDWGSHNVGLVPVLATGARVTVSNSEITMNGSFSFSGTLTGAITAQQGNNSVVTISNSKVILRAPSNSAYSVYSGGVVSEMSSGSRLSVTDSEVIYTNTATNSGTSCAYGAAIVGSPAGAASVAIKRVRASFTDTFSISCPNGIGGFMREFTQTYSGAQEIEISDSLITGYIANSIPRGIFGTLAAGSSVAASKFEIKNIISTVSYGVLGGSRYGSPNVTGYATMTGTGLVYNNDSASNISISAGGSFMNQVIAATTADMQSSAAGNIYLQNGFDFTSGTGNWKWCASGGYPRLKWESCP